MDARLKILTQLALLLFSTHALAASPKVGFGAVFGALIAREAGAGAVSQAKVQSTLIELSSATNKKLPKQLNPYTRMNSTSATGLLFQYNVQITNHAVSEVDPSLYHSETYPLLKNAICAVGGAMEVLNAGVTIRYSYSDMNGSPITQFDFNSNSCK